MRSPISSNSESSEDESIDKVHAMHDRKSKRIDNRSPTINSLQSMASIDMSSE